MKIKVSLRRGDQLRDLYLTADATATAGDVAYALAAADPAADGAPTTALTLSTREPFGGRLRTLDGATTLADSSLLSGSYVELVRATTDLAEASHGPAAAQVRVLSGPDAGREFAVPNGSSIIGRDHAADVRLNDPMVSKRHARLNVSDVIEIIDLGSANGVLVDDEQIGRTQIAASDTIVLGDTTLAVVKLHNSAVTSAESVAPQIDHIRSPRVVPQFGGETHIAPTPPKLPQPQRFPALAMLAPLIMGAVMWAITGQLLGVIMMAMSPLLLIFSWVDQKVGGRRQLKLGSKQFDEAMLRTQDRLERAREVERRARLEELPSTARLEADASRLGPLLWSERTESPTFLTLNVGTGRMPSRNTFELPQANEARAEHWEQLLALQLEFSTIDGVPVPVALRSDGSLGYAGPAGGRHAIARAAVFQVAARHSPAELVVAALVSPSTRLEWEWLKWLPHTSSSHSPIDGPLLADSRGAGATLLSQLEGLADSRLDGESPQPRGPLSENDKNKVEPPTVPAVLLVVEDSAPVDRGRLTRLLEHGPDAGIHVIWSAPHVEQLPGACRSFVELDAGGRDGIAGKVRLGERVAPIALETLDLQRAHQLARLLAPVVDIGAPERDDSDLPRSVNYPDLAGHELLDSPDAVIERWRQNNSVTPRDGSPPVPRKKEGNLRAIVGSAGSEPFVLDLRSDGPHALVGGTTGAGKSEFLQSWVLGMASAHSPDRLTFLFVDYKGGSAFADCIDLPHTVGLVTDLSPHLVRRALTSLRAELHYREHLLNAKSAKDLATLERSGDPDCPPVLIIVIDEFAALATEVPEFVDGVVDVAQRGRSLGLHLIMATQRPSGVIRDNLRANTNLRIALRMADAEDSMDILGDKQAAYFDPAIPGRGAAKSGPGRLRAFQTGYVGGHTTGEAPPAQIDIEELDFGGHQKWEQPKVEGNDRPPAGPNDITRIVKTVVSASQQLQIPTPRKPWLDELAPLYDFTRLPNPRTDEKLLLGVLDDPAAQAQPIVCFEPDQDGNLAFIGTGGSGKSTALRTLAVAAATTTRNGGPTHVYGLDFGSRGLSMLESLPHVGAIVSGDDEERVIRTIRLLRDIVEERSQRYAATRAGTIGEYRKLANAPDEPRILLLVDGIGAFKEAYEFGPANLAAWFTAFAQIAADGRAVGVHIIMAGDRPNSIPPSIASTVQRRIVLRMANEDEYLLLGVPKDTLSQASPPGRGILDDCEVQIAVLGTSSNVAVQARELEKLAAGVAKVLPVLPEPILALPDRIALASLPSGQTARPVIGMDDVALQPVAIDARGTLLLSGPPASGRTTALVTLATAVQRSSPSTQCVLLSPRRSALAHAVAWAETAEGAEQVSALAPKLISVIESGTIPLAIFIENVTEFTNSMAEFDLDALVKAAAREDHFVVGEAEISTWSQAYTLAQPFKSGRRGILLAPGDMDGDTLLGTPLGRLRRADFPPGRGFFINGGRATKVQVAITDGE